MRAFFAAVGNEGLFAGPSNSIDVRCFVAVPCPEEIRIKLSEVGRQLNGYGKMKLVEAENIHMTLKFLGEVAEEKVVEIADKLSFLEGEAKLNLTVKGLGVFPNLSRINVIWAGVDNGEKTVALQQMVDSKLVGLGFAREERFHPHYTLVRVKHVEDGERLRSFLMERKNLEFGRYTVGSVRLMASELQEEGPVYATVREYGLS